MSNTIKQCETSKTSKLCEYCGSALDAIIFNGKVVAYRGCLCADAVAFRERVAASEREAEEHDRLLRRYRFAGIPEKYLDAECDIDEYLEVLRSGQGLYFTGKSGRGKTYTACAILRHLIDNNRKARFVDMGGLSRECADARSSFQSEQAVIDRYVATEFLVIDELGADVKMNPAKAEVIRAIVSGREANKRLTIFTSNLTRSGFVQQMASLCDPVMADRLGSRIAGMTKVFHFDGEDLRLVKNR